MRDLYYEWERSQWSAGDLPFAGDAQLWRRVSPRRRRLLLEGFACCALAAERAGVALAPLVDAAPTEDQQVFLTTQLADAARQVVLFDLIGSEVVGSQGAEGKEAIVPTGFLAVVTDEIPSVLSKVSAAREESSFAEALRLVSITFGEKILLPVVGSLGRLADAEGLEACSAGLAAVARDLDRHARFAHAFFAGTA